jgi:hypothetical protein
MYACIEESPLVQGPHNDLPLSPAFAKASARKRERRFRYSSVSEVATLVGCSGMSGSILFYASMTVIRTSFCASAYRLFA